MVKVRYVKKQLRSPTKFIVQRRYFMIFNSNSNLYWLVVSNIFYVPFHIWDVILPIDFHIVQRGRLKPPTSHYY